MPCQGEVMGITGCIQYVSVKLPSFAGQTEWVDVHEEVVRIVDEKGVGKGRSGIDKE